MFIVADDRLWEGLMRTAWLAIETANFNRPRIVEIVRNGFDGVTICLELLLTSGEVKARGDNHGQEALPFADELHGRQEASHVDPLDRFNDTRVMVFVPDDSEIVDLREL